MSILNVNKINPVGGGSTVTIAGIASVTNNISVGNSVTAGSFVGPIEGNVTGNINNSSNLLLQTGGSEALRIDASGRIGINYTPGSGDGIFNAKVDSSHVLHLGHGSNKDNYFTCGTSGMQVFRSAGTERLRIHSNGLVTAPFQYHLHAERSSNQTGYNAQGDFGVPMIFNHIVSETRDSSLSSCFNTSTGVFTAPVLGLYIFNASALSSGNNVFSQSWFTLNGSRANGTDWHNGQTSHSITQNTQVIRLAAGNTVGFKPYAAGQSSLTLSSNSNHTYFKVTLIG